VYSIAIAAVFKFVVRISLLLEQQVVETPSIKSYFCNSIIMVSSGVFRGGGHEGNFPGQHLFEGGQ